MSSSADLPFVAAPAGSIESLSRTADLAAMHWGFSGPQVLRLGMNGIFTTGDGVLLRVSRPTAPGDRAIALARALTRLGLRVPTYARDEPFIDGDHAVFAIDAVEESGSVDWIAVGEMVARLHRVKRSDLPVDYPMPFCGNFPWWDFESMMADVGDRLDAESYAAIAAAIDRDLPLLDAQRGGHSIVCHGDVHPGNVIQSAQGPVLLDWDLLCTGPVAWDHAPLMTWSQRWGGDAGTYEAFAKGYGASLRGDPLAEALAELRLVAATLMRVRAARSNHAAAQEAESRLRYWRGDSDAPQWHAQ